MKKNKYFLKKALVNQTIIGIILSLITLIILIAIFLNIFNNSKYETEILTCSKYISKINGQNIYFSKNDISSNLINSLSKICPSKKEIVENKKQISKITNLYLNCYKEYNFGNNIFGNKYEKKSICFYCGEIEFRNNIKNFNNLIINELKNEKYNILFNNPKTKNTININNEIIFSKYTYPQIIEKNQKLEIFYYISTQNNNDEISTKIKNIFNLAYNEISVSPIINTIVENYQNKDIPPYLIVSGLFFQIRKNEEKLNTKQNEKLLNCDYIVIPKNQY